MPQNIYDNLNFFERYSSLPRSKHGLDGAPEWPVLQSLLPTIRNLRVLDLGCGFGWFCRWAMAAGAQSVVGVDLSKNMLKRAKEATNDKSIEYVLADLDTIDFDAASYDLVFSSLTLHYVKDLPALFNKVFRSLAPKGRFVFSVEHPIILAPTDPSWKTLDSGIAVWPLDRYLDEGPRVVNWLVDGVVKEHRTVATYVNLLNLSGHSICRVEEWGPSLEQVQENPEWAVERNRPYFLLVAAQSNQECDD